MTEQAEQVEYFWITGIEPLRQIYSEWAALCTETGADIYLTPEWFDVWWQHFGGKRALHCLTAREKSGKLVGILPFMIDRIRLGPFVVKVARLAATDPQAVVFSVPVVQVLLEPMLKTIATDILTTNKVADLVSFTPATEMGSILEACRAIQGQDGDDEAGKIVLYDKPHGSHTVFELPESFDAFLGSLSRNRRSQIRRRLRRLDEEFELRPTLVHPRKADFAKFVKFHNKQWREVGHGGHFSDWRGSAEFYADLSERLYDSGKIWFENMEGSEGLMATQFCLVSGGTNHWRLPARSTNPVYKKGTIGALGLILVVKRAIELGLTRIEAGVGAYEYKQSNGAKGVPTYRLIFTANRLGAQTRLMCLLAWARVLHLGYYRLWFGRISLLLGKVLPMKRHSIWQSWIRTRV